MFRVVLILLWFIVTTYSIADWWRTSAEEMPGRLSRLLWLFILLFTIPSFSIGSIAWIIMRLVAQAEERQLRPDSGQPNFLEQILRISRNSPPVKSAPDVALPPDEDPEFLFKLERDIARRRANERDSLPPSYEDKDTSADNDESDDNEAPPQEKPEDAPDIDSDKEN